MAIHMPGLPVGARAVRAPKASGPVLQQQPRSAVVASTQYSHCLGLKSTPRHREHGGQGEVAASV